MRVQRVIGQCVRIGIRNFSVHFLVLGALTISAAGALAYAPSTPLPAPDRLAGAVVRPTASPITDVARMMSRENPLFESFLPTGGNTQPGRTMPGCAKLWAELLATLEGQKPT